MKYLLLALLALAVAPFADAQPDSAYYGVSLGTFDYEEEDAFGGEVFADKASSYRLMVGYRFMEHLGVEGGYGKTSTIRDTATFDLFGGGTVDVALRAKFKFLTVRLVGVLPFDNGVSLLGGLGYTDVDQDFAVSVGGGSEQSGEISGNEPAYYVAAQYDWDRVAVRLGFEKFDFEGDVNVAETSVSFFYKL
jgi:opacity protein-like surface antigen